MAESHDILMRMRDLAVRASNEAPLTTADRDRLNREFRSLKWELQRKSEAVTFNTKTIFDGTFSGALSSPLLSHGLALQVGPDNGTQYRLTVFIPEMGLSGLGLSNTGGGGTRATLSTLGEARSAIDLVQAAIDEVSQVRANLGIQERRLQHVIDDLAAEDINISAAKSRIYDADMAVEIAEFTRLQILQQSGTAILAQANAQPQSVLQLLQ